MSKLSAPPSDKSTPEQNTVITYLDAVDAMLAVIVGEVRPAAPLELAVMASYLKAAEALNERESNNAVVKARLGALKQRIERLAGGGIR